MKKILAILIILIVTILVGCDKKQEVQTTNTNTQLEDNATTQQEDVKKENGDNSQETNDNEENTDKIPVVSEINAIYFSENASIIFDKSINAQDLENYVSNESKNELEDGTGLKISVENGKIVGVSENDSMEIIGTYIGLIDSKSAEFSYNSSIFRLYISEEQAEELEKIQENNLLSLKIIKDISNFKLVEFSVK